MKRQRRYTTQREFNPVTIGGCVLYLPFYKYGRNTSKFWDISGRQNNGTITGAVPAQTPLLSPVELVSNGGMETGTPPTGWSTLDSPEVFERSAVQKHSGSYSAHINDSTPSYGAFFQNLGVVLGKKYKVSFWYYLVSGTVQCFGLGDGYNYTTTGSWQYVEFFVISNGGSYNLLKFSNASNTVADEFYIDDASVREVQGYQSLGWSFDGVDDNVDCGTNVSLNILDTITILSWFRSISRTTSTYLLSRGQYQVDGWYMQDYVVTDGVLSFVSNQTGTAQVQQMVAGSMNQDKWYCVGFTKSGTTGLWYVNGVDVTATHTDLTNMQTSEKNFYVARAYTGSNGKGEFGEVVVFNRALSAQEVKNYYELTRGRYGV